MSQDKQKHNPAVQVGANIKKQGEQQYHHAAKNIDSTVRPIIDYLEKKIETDFLHLHNKYLLQGYKRKAQCFQKNLMPPVAIASQTPKNKKPKKSQPQVTPHPQSLPQWKPSPQQVLSYYNCYDQQVNTSAFRYQKIYKKSEENKLRLINCVDRCSGNSKNQNQIFEKCADGCKQGYVQVMTKLYTNFYNKFLEKV